jgi:hypothetical protein
MKAFFLLLILTGTGWGRIMPCYRVYDYVTDDELSVDLLNGLWLEGPMVYFLSLNLIRYSVSVSFWT